MRTNLEKWNYYLANIKQIEQDFIDSNIPKLPEYVYEVYPSGKMRNLNVVKTSYSSRLYFSGKKPTKIDVSKIKDHFDNPPQLTMDKILIHWECKDNGMKSSSAIKYPDLETKYFTNKADAEIKSNELKAITAREEEMLSNGHIRCSYCSKVVPEKESVPYTIIFQNSRPDPFSRSGYKRFVDKKVNKYCSKTCGVHDQMAHEG